MKYLIVASLLQVMLVATVTADDILPPDRLIGEVIDHYVDARLQAVEVTPAPQADDATLVRRLTLDLAGRIPTTEESHDFVASTDPRKRERLIERLLASPDFVRHSATEFDALLQGYSDKPVKLRDYLLTACGENRTWDRMFRELLADSPDAPLASQFLTSRLGDHDALVRDVSSIFFGVNIECARCHDHPRVERFTQDYYYGLKAYFSRLHLFQNQLSERQYGELRYRPTRGEEREVRPVFLTGLRIDEPQLAEDELKKLGDAETKLIAELNNAFKDKKEFPAPPAFSRRQKFVEAGLSDGGRQLLAASLANRLWYRFFGRGLVMNVDQMHDKNPASHESLLQWLTRDTVNHGFDSRRLVQGIVSSRAYSRSSRYDGESSLDPSLFAVATLRPLTPLQFGVSLRIAGDPQQLPINLPTDQRMTWLVQLEKEAEPYLPHVPRLQPGDQFGITEASRFSNDEKLLDTLAQKLVPEMLALPEAHARIEAAFWAVLSRPPTKEEIGLLSAFLTGDKPEPDAVRLARAKRQEIEAAHGRLARSEARIREINSLAVQKSRRGVLERTADSLAATAELLGQKDANLDEVARRHQVDASLLRDWFQLASQSDPATALLNAAPFFEPMTEKMESINQNTMLRGWGTDATPWFGINVHDKPANAGFVVPPRSLAMHPSPEKDVALVWQSPIAGRVRLNGRIVHSHDACGNGVVWSVLHRHDLVESKLAGGDIDRGRSYPNEGGPVTLSELDVGVGDSVLLAISARDRNHACDTTVFEFVVTEINGEQRVWNATSDILENRLAVWQIGKRNAPGTSTPADRSPTLLTRWRASLKSTEVAESTRLATNLQSLLLAPPSPTVTQTDMQLRELLLSPTGPLFRNRPSIPQFDEAAKSELAQLTADIVALRPLASQPLPPLDPATADRPRRTLQRMTWALMMSPEFRFNH